MAVTATPVFPQTIKNYVTTIAIGDTNTVKTLAAAGTNGSKIEALTVSSTDTTTRDLQFFATISATNYLLGTVNIPINAGNINSTTSVDILRNAQIPGLAYDANGNKFLYLASGTTLSVGSTTTVTTAKTVTIFAQGEDF